MEIRVYNQLKDEDNIMKIIEAEGEEWSCYSDKNVSDKYRFALRNSITYVAYENGELCGYSRSLNDCGFYIYVCDLLVSQKFRGKDIGKKLLELVKNDFTNHKIYVMSDVDKYYEKLGYKKEGSIFEV